MNNRKKNFLEFINARKFVVDLGLKNRKEWQVYSSLKRPQNIPSNPDKIYKNVATFRKYEDWRKFLKYTQRPLGIPSAPEVIYKNKWRGWKDILNTENVEATIKEVS